MNYAACWRSIGVRRRPAGRRLPGQVGVVAVTAGPGRSVGLAHTTS